MLRVYYGLLLSSFCTLWLEEGHGWWQGGVTVAAAGRVVTRTEARDVTRGSLRGSGVTERVAASDHDVLSLPRPVHARRT